MLTLQHPKCAYRALTQLTGAKSQTDSLKGMKYRKKPKDRARKRKRKKVNIISYRKVSDINHFKKVKYVGNITSMSNYSEFSKKIIITELNEGQYIHLDRRVCLKNSKQIITCTYSREKLGLALRLSS